MLLPLAMLPNEGAAHAKEKVATTKCKYYAHKYILVIHIFITVNFHILALVEIPLKIAAERIHSQLQMISDKVQYQLLAIQ